MQNACELIQHYGDLRDSRTGRTVTPEVAVQKIGAALTEAKAGYEEANTWLRKWYLDSKAQGRITEAEED